MNKNIIIGVIASVVVVGVIIIVGLAQYNLLPAPVSPQVNSALVAKDISDLNALDSQVAAISDDSAIENEIDSALNEVGEISPTTSVNDEVQNLNSLSSDLDSVSADESVSSELDQMLVEASAN